MYVTNSGSQYVSVINPANQVIDNIYSGNTPTGVAYNAANGDMYVANYGDNTVSVISPSLSTQPPSNKDNNTLTAGGFSNHGGNSIAIPGSANGGNGILNGIGGNGGHSGSAASTDKNIINDNNGSDSWNIGRDNNH